MSRAIAIRATMVRRLTLRGRRALVEAAKLYGRFQESPVELSVD